MAFLCIFLSRWLRRLDTPARGTLKQLPLGLQRMRSKMSQEWILGVGRLIIDWRLRDPDQHKPRPAKILNT